MTLFKTFLRPFKDWRIGRLPSRIYLREAVIPALAAAGYRRMLFVGTRSYNRSAYEACVRQGLSVWSIDLDPAASAHGAPDGHLIGNICDIDKLAGGRTFDVIMFNGVLGWGLNTAAETRAALGAMVKVAAPGALLFVGWNPGLTTDAEITVIREGLKRVTVGKIPEEIEFPPKGGAQKYPHRYELFSFA